MDSLLGSAIGSLALEVGGQLVVELPDDLSPTLVREIVAGVNASAQEKGLYCTAVYDQRKELATVSPGGNTCTLRELAKYREGNLLAIAYASDFRGMNTYTTVLQKLFSPAFPSEPRLAVEEGAASLRDLSAALSRHLKHSHRVFSDVEDLGAAMEFVIGFITRAHSSSSHATKSLRSDWWKHVAYWLKSLSGPGVTAVSPASTPIEVVSIVFAAAGLPRPRSLRMEAYSLSPDDYVLSITERWATAEQIESEIERLAWAAPSGVTEGLSKIDWADELPRAQIDSPSPLLAVALAGSGAFGVADRTTQLGRLDAWRGISDSDFKSIQKKKSTARFRQEGRGLPTPWAGGPEVLPISRAWEVPGESAIVEIPKFGILVPWVEGRGELSASVDVLNLFSIDASGARFHSFKQTSFHASSDGVLFEGLLNIEKLAHPTAIRISLHGNKEAVRAGLADGLTGTFYLVPPDFSIVLYRTKRQRRAQFAYTRVPPASPVSLELSSPGRYEVGLVLPEGDAYKASVSSTHTVAEWHSQALSGRTTLLQFDISEEVTLEVNGNPAYVAAVTEPNVAELSPLRAAAQGAAPKYLPLPLPSALMTIESAYFEVLEALERGERHVLGAVWVTEGATDGDFTNNSHGCFLSRECSTHFSDFEPGKPSTALIESAEYKGLQDAYAKLGIAERIKELSRENSVSGLTISRIPLDFIDEKAISDLLGRYVELINTCAGSNAADAFWSRMLFSVAIFRAESGFRQPIAIMLSPLHPLRLAWMWYVQTSTRAEYDSGGEPLAILQLLDALAYPAVGSFRDGDGEIRKFIPATMDYAPEGIYLGWEALVFSTGSKLELPTWLLGRRFPAAGSSGLAPSSVSSSVDSYLRVNPYVRALRVSVSSPSVAGRSANLDEGLLDLIGELAVGAKSGPGVSSIFIHDSENRDGPSPNLRRLRDGLAVGKSDFAVTWSTKKEEDVSGDSHICFVEGSTASFAVQEKSGASIGMLPAIPLRRFPRLDASQGNQLVVDYSLSETPFSLASLHEALRAFELSPSGKALVTRVRANTSALKTDAKWVVIGSHSIDPVTLSRASAQTGLRRRVLWDWRPAATLAAIKSTKSVIAQPYSILAQIPESLTNSLRGKVSLITDATGDELSEKIAQVVSLLSARAIGLNTLLAMGHQQDTGALGFYFALQILRSWSSNSEPGELRLVVPVDAVDPLLRSIVEDRGDLTRRADLLALSAKVVDGIVVISMCPIEVKHYGLTSEEVAARFPDLESQGLMDHRGQLEQYSCLLQRLAARLLSDDETNDGIARQKFATVLECAYQLGPSSEVSEDSTGIYLRSVNALLDGTAKLVIQKGLLFWFQAKVLGETRPAKFNILDAVRTSEGALDEVGGLFIDPAAYAKEFWTDARIDLADRAIRWAFSSTAAMDSVGEPLHNAETQGSDYTELSARDDSLKLKTPTSPPYVAPLIAKGPEVGLRLDQRPTSKRLSVDELERRYLVILRALDEFRVRVRRPDGNVPAYKEGPAFVEYAVSPDYGVSATRIESQLQNLKLRLRLSDESKIGSRIHLGNVLLAVPKADEDRYFVDAKSMWGRWERPSDAFSVPLGEDVTGEIVAINFSDSNSPHVLIAGVTGGGKSEALLTILRGAVEFYSDKELRLRLVDPKGTELNPLEDFPHLEGPIAWDASQAAAMLEEAVIEMNRRYELFASVRVRDLREYNTRSVSPIPRWLIVLDEYADLTSDDEDRKTLEGLIKRLAQKARAAGIHLIVSTQKPVVKVVNTVIKGNLPARIALRCNTDSESRVVLDEGGAETLSGKGDALLKVGSITSRMQFARWNHD